MSGGTGTLQTFNKREQAGPPFVAGSANNGLSVDPVTGKIVLGNDVGAAGDPAQLLSDRQIALVNFFLEFLNNTGTDHLAINATGADPFGIRFTEDTWPQVISITLNQNSELVFQQQGNGEVLRYTNWFFPYFILHENGGFPSIAGALMNVVAVTAPVGLGVEYQGADNSVSNVLRVENTGGATGGSVVLTSDGAGKQLFSGVAGATYGEPALAGNPLIATDNTSALQLAALGNAGGDFIFFTRLLAFPFTITERMRLLQNGNLGIGVAAPTAYLHLAAGTAVAGTAPFKYTAGVNLAVVENGAKEFDGTNEFLSVAGVRYTMAKTLTATANLDFPNTAAQTSSDLTIALNGAADGDVVLLGVPIAALLADSCYTAFVSAANVITVRFNNYSAGALDPAAGVFRVSIVKY